MFLFLFFHEEEGTLGLLILCLGSILWLDDDSAILALIQFEVCCELIVTYETAEIESDTIRLQRKWEYDV